jgi:WD40 repeat protein
MAIPTMAGTYIYDAKLLEEGHRIPVATSFIAFSLDGSLLTASQRGLVDLWNPATGERIGKLPGDPEIHQYPLFLSRDGTLLAANWDNEVSAWSLERVRGCTIFTGMGWSSGRTMGRFRNGNPFPHRELK